MSQESGFKQSIFYRSKKIISMSNSTQNCNNVLYVSNFQRNTSESDIQKLFTSFGTINSISIIPKAEYAFAFVQFDDIRDAVDAVKGLNKSFFRGRNLKVQYKNSRSLENNPPTAKPSCQRQADTGDQAKSKEQIQAQKKPVEVQEPPKKKKKRGKRRYRHRRSRSRSRNKKTSRRSRSRSASDENYSHYSDDEQRSSDVRLRKCTTQIQKLHSIIEKLQRRVRILEDERGSHHEKRYGYSNR